jgi:hypothetical protein
VQRINGGNLKYPFIQIAQPRDSYYIIYKLIEGMYYVAHKLRIGRIIYETTMNSLELDKFLDNHADYHEVSYLPAPDLWFTVYSIFDYDRIDPQTSYEQYLAPRRRATARPNVPEAAIATIANQHPGANRSLLNGFLNRRSQNTPMYRIADYTDPTTFERVKNLTKALFIQENVRDGSIHGLYDPESLYAWSEEQKKMTSPVTRRPVTKPFLRLPTYLIQ